MLNPSDFSVVVQGPVHGKPTDEASLQLTKRCIESARAFLPGAEIILSTWKGSDVSHLDFDILIENEDPGGTSYYDSNTSKFNNNNRQIVSTRNGVLKATRTYTMKLRSDCRLIHGGFMDYLGKYSAHNDYKVFEERVLTSVAFTKDPRRVPILYHVSDIFQVGLTTDMQLLWDIPLQPEPETTRRFPENHIIYNEAYPYEAYKMRYACEQYIWYACAAKKGIDLRLDYYTELPFSKIALSEKTLIDNFVFLELDQLGLRLPEKMDIELDNPTLYSFAQWEALYHAYCVAKKSNDFWMALQVKWNSFRYILKNFRRRKKRLQRMKRG
ncbi:MAG: hypothetical protein RLZZ500_761 [Bacteroidota bacterium]|jgi:hypothetical protein